MRAEQFMGATQTREMIRTQTGPMENDAFQMITVPTILWYLSNLLSILLDTFHSHIPNDRAFCDDCCRQARQRKPYLVETAGTNDWVIGNELVGGAGKAFVNNSFRHM